MRSRRLSAFERGISEIHGRATIREIGAEIIEPMPVNRWRGVDHVGLRLTLGVLGLFWGVIGLAVLIALVGFVLMAVWPT